jgi:hypothetical protein
MYHQGKRIFPGIMTPLLATLRQRREITAVVM